MSQNRVLPLPEPPTTSTFLFRAFLGSGGRLLIINRSVLVTDPKGSIVVECGNALLKNGYKLKILNTINFKKSMHYNPFAYVHSEKDILKLVTTLMTNTKGEGSGGDPFWYSSSSSSTCMVLSISNSVAKFCSSKIGRAHV